MRVIIQENYDKMCKWAADYIAAKIKNHHEDRPFVLGLPTGSSPIGVYKELARMNRAGELSFANVVTFNMDEYLGLPHEHDQSYWYFMHDNFFDHLVDMKPEEMYTITDLYDLDHALGAFRQEENQNFEVRITPISMYSKKLIPQYVVFYVFFLTFEGQKNTALYGR